MLAIYILEKNLVSILTHIHEYDNIANVRGYGGIGRRARFRF